VFPWGRQAKFTGPYVLPSSTRRFEVSRPGSFLGLLPVTLLDTATGQGSTRWVFACTGVYAYVLLLALVMLAAWMVYRTVRRQPILPRRLFRRHKPTSARKPMDGLSRKND